MSQGTFTEKLIDKIGMELWPKSDPATRFADFEVYMTLVEMYGDRREDNPVAAKVYEKAAELVGFATDYGNDTEETQTAANEALAMLRKLFGTTPTCKYSAAHASRKVPAVTEIDCRPVGILPACQACAEFFAKHA
jgi:hypothetical protein